MDISRYEVNMWFLFCMVIKACSSSATFSYIMTLPAVSGAWYKSFVNIVDMIVTSLYDKYTINVLLFLRVYTNGGCLKRSKRRKLEKIRNNTRGSLVDN